METKLNIAEILKDKPKETKLYADAFGELSIEDIFVENELGINLSTKDGDDLYFYNDGKYNVHGEPILAPSKEMRDWSKFTWKRGDVLVSNNKSTHIVFKEFQDDTYKTFIGNYYFENSHYSFLEKTYETKDFCKEIDSEAKTYINFLEKITSGKLNLETLKIEKPQPKFKDGDIVCYNSLDGDKCIGIVKEIKNDAIVFHVDYNLGVDNMDFGVSVLKEYFEFYKSNDLDDEIALNKALHIRNKAWDAEKKEIVELKHKIEFKSFDKVMARNTEHSTWYADLFSHIDENHRYACVGATWNFCIPYNNKTAKLIGTTNTVEEN